MADMAGCSLANVDQIAPRRLELEEIIELGNAVDTAEREAQFTSSVLELELGKVSVVTLNLFQHGDEGVGLATVRIDDGGELWRRGVGQGIAPVFVFRQVLCRCPRSHDTPPCSKME